MSSFEKVFGHVPPNLALQAFLRRPPRPAWDSLDKRVRRRAREQWMEEHGGTEPPPWFDKGERTRWFQARAEERREAERVEAMAERIAKLERRIKQLEGEKDV